MICYMDRKYAIRAIQTDYNDCHSAIETNTMPEKPSQTNAEQRIRELEERLVKYRHCKDMLSEKDALLKATLASFEGLIYICSQDYRIEYMNAKYIDRIGFDATGQICYQALHKRNDICPWCLNQRIFEGETVQCEVFTHRRKWYHVVSTPIDHKDGSVSKQAMIIEITDRKRAEESLKKKVEEQELLLDNIQTQIWYLTDVKTYGAINKAHADFLGKQKHELEGKTLYDVFNAEKANIFVTLNHRVFKEKARVSTEEWVMNGEGESRLLSIVRSPKLDNNGNVEYVVCSGEDITDFRATEEKLRQSKKRLDLAMEATSDALWDMDLQTGKAYFNPCYYTMLGYKPYELPPSFTTWKSLIHPQDKEAIIKKMENMARQTLGSFQVECRMRMKQGGWRWIMARGKVVKADRQGKTTHRMVGTNVDITNRKRQEVALSESAAHLFEENSRLRSILKTPDRLMDIIGKSQKMQEVYEVILKAALSPANVVIYGESGTGKELAAKTIHNLSQRGGQPFITVNCGAIPDNLLESEFFGYQKGAFTGAHIDKPGYLDMADHGTLFMDEVGELDLNLQVKLLRAIEGGGYAPLGSREIKKSDMRIIAATNRDLTEALKQGQIRVDFFYRIHIIPVYLPPLRERKEDIPLLIHHFLATYDDEATLKSIPDSVIKAMRDYDWPGNVRELQNAVHRYVTLKEIDFLDIPINRNTDSTIGFEEELTAKAGNPDLRTIMDRCEKKYIQKVLSENQWHRGRAASVLGINRKTLFKKIKHHRLHETGL